VEVNDTWLRKIMCRQEESVNPADLPKVFDVVPLPKAASGRMAKAVAGSALPTVAKRKLTSNSQH
jgi:hypothetical protein